MDTGGGECHSIPPPIPFPASCPCHQANPAANMNDTRTSKCFVCAALPLPSTTPSPLVIPPVCYTDTRRASFDVLRLVTPVHGYHPPAFIPCLAPVICFTSPAVITALHLPVCTSLLQFFLGLGRARIPVVRIVEHTVCS